ncbi:outer membrane beta-barrel protein [Bacteriovorax sp. Seq25_V]|uniref:outer membrane beta-barrel protein n=1 Tax=Bacteriovorax sp. Seq25_V TaxID=1201288 RepID=UPI000389F413|nr:outer membrane beta-barrel protein [Bacteriovorax sp. Seq25_V]EQC43589.1 outer membrane protein beta-barrel domain protein [Bacteriovorax sp. Seq25_V]
MKKLLLAVFMTVSASAGFLVEPYLGYQLGSGDAGATDYTFNTTVIGGRVGYTMLGFMGGLDYSMGAESDLEGETAGVKTKTKFSQNNLGLFAGYELPILLRAWATYYLSTNLEQQEGTNKGKEYSGDGIGFGVGFTGLPFVSLNLEYRMMSYDEFDGKSLTNKLEENFVLLGVSLPLDL